MNANLAASPLIWRWWRVRAAALVAGAAIIGFGIMPVAAAGTDPFTLNSKGFDVSYPNCTSTLPSGDSFAIVGVTGGRPFSTYSCFGKLWSGSQKATDGTPSLYFNTGYSGAYGRDISSFCASAEKAHFSGPTGLSRHLQKQAQQAWEIGCSEVAYALTAFKEAFPSGPEQPTMLFADIETGNSWSSNVTLNQSAIDGISWAMENMGSNGLGGIYSSAAMWATITGSDGFSPSPNVSANWVVGARCPTSSNLSAPFDAASPMWISQGSAASGIDTDTAC